MKNWADIVVSKWKTEGVEVGQPATIESIKLTEAVLDFKFPDDFKQLYMEIDGFKSFYMEKHMFTLWPLKTIIEEYDGWGDQDFIGFCDYLIASHAIGFKRNEKGVFKLYQEPIPIAETFKDLISMINSNSDLIY